MTRVLVVGGGIIGTAHAYEAIERGFEVDHFEAAPEAREASVRSLGGLSFSAAAPGLDLSLSLEARHRWTQMLGEPHAQESPNEPLLRPTGSLVVATDADDSPLLEKLASQPDADERGWVLHDRARVEADEPALAGTYFGALHSHLDAVIDPAATLRAIRARMERTGNYRFRAGTEIQDVQSDGVVDFQGKVTKGDLVIVCPGASFRLAASMLRQPSNLRSVRIQAVQTAAPAKTLSTPLTDLRSLLLGGVEGSDRPAREVGPGETELRVRVKCVPRPNGSLLVGEVQDAEDPHGFDLQERPMAEVIRRLERMFGAAIPQVTRRWSGKVHESTDGRLWHRSNLDHDVAVVTGTDERGVTLAPAIARDTFDWLIDGTESGGSSPGAKHS